MAFRGFHPQWPAQDTKGTMEGLGRGQLFNSWIPGNKERREESERETESSKSHPHPGSHLFLPAPPDSTFNTEIINGLLY